MDEVTHATFKVVSAVSAKLRAENDELWTANGYKKEIRMVQEEEKARLKRAK